MWLHRRFDFNTLIGRARATYTELHSSEMLELSLAFRATRVVAALTVFAFVALIHDDLHNLSLPQLPSLMLPVVAFMILCSLWLNSQRHLRLKYRDFDMLMRELDPLLQRWALRLTWASARWYAYALSLAQTAYASSVQFADELSARASAIQQNLRDWLLAMTAREYASSHVFLNLSSRVHESPAQMPATCAPCLIHLRC